MNENDGLTIHSTAFEAGIVRLAATSTRAGVDIMRQKARLVFVDVAKYTPPASQGSTGRLAEIQGKAKVAADIRDLYGTPDDAFAAIALVDRKAAGEFWYLHNHDKDEVAAQIVRNTLGKSFATFDGGTLHSRTANGRRRRRKDQREHVYYVTNPQSLTAFIENIQSHVWYFASGWRTPLQALQAKVPYGADKFSAPGQLHISITETAIEITMENDVKYGREVRAMERRILWAMNIQAKKMDRAWNHYLATAARDAGFKAFA